jgi:hypothetical protein
VPDWNNYREEYHTFLLHSRIWETERHLFVGIGLGRHFEIRHDPARDSFSVLGTKLGTIIAEHPASTERPLQHSETATVRTRVARAALIDKKTLADRETACTFSILEDFESFWFVIAGRLERRLGFEKAYELLHNGVVWRVFDGGKSRGEEEKALKGLREVGLKDETQSYYQLVMSWSQHFISSMIEEEEDDDDIGKAELETPPEEDEENEDKSSKNSEDSESEWPHGDALYNELLFETCRIGLRAAGKSFFVTDNGFVGRGDHPIQGMLDAESIGGGDIVCIMQRCTKPVILRPCEDGRYRLMSFAYVHDVFEESDTAIDLSKREGEWFELC